MTYFIEQIKQKDCSFACLKILLATVHKNKNYLLYPQNLDDSSYSLDEIIRYAKNENVKLGAYHFENKEDLLQEKTFPILAVTKENDRLHMIVIYKIKRKKVYVGDPSKGKLTYKLNEFYDIWNGEALIIEGIEETKTKYKVKKDILNNVYVLISGFFQIFSFISLAVGIFFINDEVSFLIPVCLFIGYILFEFIHKQISMTGMKILDDKIYANLPKNTSNLANFYRNISLYKANCFINPIQIISSILSLLLIIIALGLNSYLNILNIGIIGIFNASFYYFFNHYIKSKERTIYDNEALLKQNNLSTSEVERALRLLNYETYKLSQMLYFRKYVLLAITILLCLFYAALTDNISLNFILFHVFAYYLFTEFLTTTLETAKKESKKIYYKCIIKNYFQY